MIIGRSPDFVQRETTLPGVSASGSMFTPVYSGGTVPDFHRLPFSFTFSAENMNTYYFSNTIP